MRDIDQYYKILELDPGASLEQIKQAYRDLAKVWHPDRFAHDQRLQEKAQEKMKEINEAYDQLQSLYKDNLNKKNQYQPPRTETESTSTKHQQSQTKDYPYSTNASKKQANYWKIALTLTIIIVFFLVLLQQYNQYKEKLISANEAHFRIKSDQNPPSKPYDSISNSAFKQNDEKESKDKSEELKNTDIPKAINSSGEDVIKRAEKEKEKSVRKNNSNLTPNSNINSEGRGNQTNGIGSFGYGIDWGGQGQREIYNYIIPEYPEGVEKEIDIKLKFTIMPDGTVGDIIPLTNADTRLEIAAINSLRQWRFQPLAPDQKQIEQGAVIVFP